MPVCECAHVGISVHVITCLIMQLACIYVCMCVNEHVCLYIIVCKSGCDYMYECMSLFM